MLIMPINRPNLPLLGFNKPISAKIDPIFHYWVDFLLIGLNIGHVSLYWALMSPNSPY